MIRPIRPATALCCALALAGAARAADPTPDWRVLSEVEVIRAITHDEDGDERDTKIWFAVVDGQGFIRTGSSRWGENLERDPELVLRIQGQDYPLRADFIENEGLRERVIAAFREKYGWTDALIGIFRGSHPKIMHMLPR